MSEYYSLMNDKQVFAFFQCFYKIICDAVKEVYLSLPPVSRSSSLPCLPSQLHSVITLALFPLQFALVSNRFPSAPSLRPLSAYLCAVCVCVYVCVHVCVNRGQLEASKITLA